MKKRLLAYVAAGLVFLLVTAAVCGLLGTYMHARQHVLYLTPLYHDAKGWELYTVADGTHHTMQPEELFALDTKTTFYLSRTLPQSFANDGYTFLSLASERPCAVFLEDSLLYTTCPETAPRMDSVVFPDTYTPIQGRGEYVRCTLPADSVGKTLTIATRHMPSEYESGSPRILLSSEAAESESFMAGANTEMIPATGFAMTALLLFGIWLFALVQNVRAPRSLLLIFAAFLQAFRHLRQYDFLSPASTAMNIPFARCIPYIAFALPVLYLCAALWKNRSRLLLAAVIFAAVAAKLTTLAALYSFWDYCSIYFFILAVFYDLHKLLQSMLQIHTQLALQTEQSNQLAKILTMQKDFYEAKQLHEQEIHALRHDMRGHLATLSALLDSGDSPSAKAYLDDILKQHAEQTMEHYSDNSYINAVLHNYAARCKENRIRLLHHIESPRHELPAMQLCLIFNNLLENAVDACLLLPEADREIEIRTLARQNTFLLRISNRFDGTLKTENGLPVTTKEGGSHGYGMRNVQNAAKQINGSMEYNVRDGQFIVSVLLANTRI